MAQICGQFIPQELIDAIIGHLPDDKASFRSCSLVSRSFTEPSHRRLFHQLELVIDGAAAADTGLQTHSQVSVTRASWVRVLYIRIARHHLNLTAYPELLKRFTGLERVILRCEGDGKNNDDVIRHCCKPTIQQLSITQRSNTLWPWSHLHQCRDLHHLSIHCALPSSSDLERIRPEYARIPLRSLYINALNANAAFTEIIQDPRLPFRIDTLTALGIVARTAGHLETIRTILPTLQNLEKLAIGSNFNFNGTFVILDLSPLPRLNFLLLSTYEDLDTSFMTWIRGQLSALPSTTTIHTLHLVTAIYSPTDELVDLQQIAKRWTVVDNLLSESRFKVQSAVLHIYNRNRHEVLSKTMIDLIGSAMPRLMESKRLKVKELDPEYQRPRPDYTTGLRPLTFFSDRFLLDLE